MPSTIFISHSTKDRPTANAICAHLESIGVNCWIAPRDIEPGATWTRGIMQGLEACRVLILVFSEHANNSDHVQREVAKAFSSGLAVIPFRIEHVLPNQSLAYFLDTVQWLDAGAPPLPQQLGTLTERVKKLLGAETARQLPRRSGPEKISVARLPVTGSEVFGREEDITFLDEAWANQRVNVVTIVAWGGVGKSTLVNHWLRRMAAENYRSAQLVFGWSFYRQGTSGGTSSADEFLDAALIWFGDPDPRLGTAWEKGERLAKLVGHRRTLLVLDGLEPLQNPPGTQEGRLRDPSLQALLRELAAFNKGLCVITTRLPVADLSDHEASSAHRRHLEYLSSDAGAQLLRALGVKGDEAELRSASDEFNGHCLALTLLGSYLTDAYNGDIRSRNEVSGHLAQDVRQGAHARKVMESYQTWFGEGPELSVLRMLGLFDRPAEEKAIAALLKPPAIPGLTESLTNLSPTEWRMIIARLRRARLLAGEDPHNPGSIDTHPLVREYYGEQLRGQRSDAWKECNKRLFNYYRTLAPQLPDSFAEMEPLFLAVICGCKRILLITLCLLPRLVEAKILVFGNATDPGLGLPTGHPNGYPFVWPDALFVSEGIFNEATCLDSDHEYQIQTGVNQFNGVLGEGWQPLDKFYVWTRKHHYYYLWYGGFMAGPGNGPGTRSKEAFINWVTAAAGRAPGIEYINFANEPIHAGSAHPFARQWGGAGSTGYDWLINIGKLFRAKFPNAQLGINDFQQESSVDDLPYGPGQNKTQLPQFLRMVKVLKDAGVIDWVGLEGYSLETVPSEHLSSALNQISQLGVKVI